MKGIVMLKDKFFVKSALALLSFTLFQGCQPAVDRSEIEFQVPVTVSEVSVSTIEERIVTTGTLRAPEVVTLKVKTGGILQIADGKNGRLAEGDTVKAGDLIGSITGEDARLAVKRESVKQRLETARKNLESSKILFEKNLISVSQYGEVKDLLEDAKLAYQISLNTETQNNIRSPIDGVILKLSRNEDGQRMANGQPVEAGQIIAQVAPLDHLTADIDLVSTDIPLVNKGLEARVNSHIWGDESFRGEVLRLVPTVDERTRTLQAEVSIDNEKGRLKPGMFVEVTLIVDRKENVPVIYNRSLTDRGGRKVVFVANGSVLNNERSLLEYVKESTLRYLKVFVLEKV